MPRSVCMDENKAWLVDFRIGYRCKALMKVQREWEKKDQELEERQIPAYPYARKWSATEYIDGSLNDAGQDSQG